MPARDVVGSDHQKTPQQGVPRFRDPQQRLLLPGVTLLGAKADVRPHRTALREATRILNRQHVVERRDRADARDLTKELRLRVPLPAQPFHLLIHLLDRRRQLLDNSRGESD